MAQTTILALGSTNATSSAITVTAGSAVTVGIYGNEQAPPNGYDMALVIDTPGTAHQQVYDEKGPVILRSGRPQVTIQSPGTYYIVRTRTESTTATIGAYTES